MRESILGMINNNIIWEDNNKVVCCYLISASTQRSTLHLFLLCFLQTSFSSDLKQMFIRVCLLLEDLPFPKVFVAVNET